jgi:hypothetical protein
MIESTHAQTARGQLVRLGNLTVEDRVGVQVEAFTEPLTALITLPFAFVGELAWNLAWLLIIPEADLMRRRARRVM